MDAGLGGRERRARWRKERKGWNEKLTRLIAASSQRGGAVLEVSKEAHAVTFDPKCLEGCIAWHTHLASGRSTHTFTLSIYLEEQYRR